MYCDPFEGVVTPIFIYEERMTMTTTNFRSLVELSIHNSTRIQSHKQRCACFSCGKIFSSNQVEAAHALAEASGPATVVCPYCGIDTVLCEDDFLQCGTPLTEASVAEVMRLNLEDKRK